MLAVRALVLATILFVAGTIGLRPAAACDDRVAGACKGAPILHSTETGLTVNQPGAASGARRSYSRRGVSRRAARREARRERAERRARTRQEVEDTDAEMKMPRPAPRRAAEEASAHAALPMPVETLYLLPNTPKIGSTFVLTGPPLLSTPSAIAAAPLPEPGETQVARAGEPVSTPPPAAAPAPPAVMASAPAAAPPSATPAPRAPALTAEQRAAAAQALATATGGAAVGNTATGNTGTAAGAAPVALASGPPNNDGDPSMLRYAILAFAGLLALGTVARMAFG
jgi:hypothetical protein